jgi:uncharacterized protein YjbI with pentapeptide repeats
VRSWAIPGYRQAVEIGPGADLADADLSGADLAGRDLSGANLAGAYLSDANLTGAVLVGANLTGAHLSRAELVGANLTDANLSDTDLSTTLTFNATLTGVVLPTGWVITTPAPPDASATGDALTPDMLFDMLAESAESVFGDLSDPSRDDAPPTDPAAGR